MRNLLLVLPLAITCAFASAAPREASGPGASDVGVQRLLRQLTAERDQLLIEKQKLEKVVSEKDEELKKIDKKISGKTETLDKYKDVNGQLIERLQLAQDKLIEMNAAYLDQQQKLMEAQEESDEYLALFSRKQLEVEQQVFNNRRMLEINKELLGKYSDKGFLQLLSSKEPLTQLNKVAVENIIQQYQFELEDISMQDGENQVTQNY